MTGRRCRKLIVTLDLITKFDSAMLPLKVTQVTRSQFTRMGQRLFVWDDVGHQSIEVVFNNLINKAFYS